MEVFNDAFAALNVGVDTLIEAGKPILAAYVLYLLARGRTALLKGVPAWLHAVIAGWIEQMLTPLVTNAVLAAEEYGARKAKEYLSRGQAYIKKELSAEKLAVAKAYVLRRIPDWLVSDERLGEMIDAALVAIGRGATKGVQVGIEVVEDQIQRIPPPPPLLPPVV